MATEQFMSVVKSRISDHRAAEERRLNAERERIRAEEQAKAERDAREKLAREQRERDEAAALERRQREAEEAAARPVVQPAPVVASVAPSQPAANTPAVVPIRAEAPAAPPSLRLGQIKDRIAPLSIDADGLARLGFSPAATDKNAKLYHEADFPRMVDSMVAHLRMAQQQFAKAA